MIDDCTGIGESVLLEEASVYPNPASTQVNINLSVEDGVSYTVDVYNSTGQKVYSVSETGSSTAQIHNIQISEFPKGLYIVNVSSNDASLWRGKFEKGN